MSQSCSSWNVRLQQDGSLLPQERAEGMQGKLIWEPFIPQSFLTPQLRAVHTQLWGLVLLCVKHKSSPSAVFWPWKHPQGTEARTQASVPFVAARQRCRALPFVLLAGRKAAGPWPRRGRLIAGLRPRRRQPQQGEGLRGHLLTASAGKGSAPLSKQPGGLSFTRWEGSGIAFRAASAAEGRSQQQRIGRLGGVRGCLRCGETEPGSSAPGCGKERGAGMQRRTGCYRE